MEPLVSVKADKRETGACAPAFGDIYEEHFDFVWRSARRLGLTEELLDDAVQDVFLVVHRRLADFEGRSSIKTWLFGIVLRTVRGYRRSERRKPRGSIPVPENTIDPRATGPLESAARSEAVGLLYRFLDGLDDEKREVFVQAELEQMTVQEIAETTGVNVNTVYSRLRAARKSFNQAVARMRAQDGWRYR